MRFSCLTSSSAQLCLFAVAGSLLAPVAAFGGDPPEGLVSLFDGKTLDGWEGDRKLWSVHDGAVTGQTSKETQLRSNQFILWKDQLEDFELQLKFRMDGGNSGIYYRARKRPL